MRTSRRVPRISELNMPQMTSADHYRIKAAEFAAMARTETEPKLQVEFAKMAASYLRLAEQADRNSHADVVYQPPLTESRNAG
ncbi:MAG TPA: hypothetical protein VFK79_01135 [Xanthobacteraceae bacterium]|nr:hypothetical protein [Xanthobacteraceae bacterium]